MRTEDLGLLASGVMPLLANGASECGLLAGRYELIAERGRGAMGVVYKARDHKLDRFVALKFLPAQWSRDESTRNRFRREARAGSATYHPNICTIHNIDATDDGQLFIVMAYYDGETLKEKLERGPMDLREAVDVATQVADGLARLHESGVVHRDIKPGNLMLTDGTVKILDFGLARLASEQQLTIAGSAAVGTVAYMAPEQAKGQDAAAGTDIWALGVVFYEMLTGHVPFRGAHADAVLYAIRNEPVPPLRPVRPHVPAAIEKVVRKALSKTPERRFHDARELWRELRAHRDVAIKSVSRGAGVSHGRSNRFALPH